MFLQLNKTVPLSYLEGELFQADVTCRAEHTNGKLLFKFNGTRILSDRGTCVHTYMCVIIDYLATYVRS